MVTLYFTREFTKGNLRGIRHNDKISFPDYPACVQWARAINAKADAGTLPYRIVDRSFQNYQR